MKGREKRTRKLHLVLLLFCDWHEVFKISLVTRRWKFLHRVIINIQVYHKKGNVAQCKKNCRGFSVPLTCFFKDFRVLFVVTSINEKTATPLIEYCTFHGRWNENKNVIHYKSLVTKKRLKKQNRVIDTSHFTSQPKSIQFTVML